MKTKIALLLVCLLLLSACQPAAAGAAGEYHKITPEEAKNMMDTQTVTIVDVRTEAEYQEGHVPQAILVPNESIEGKKPDALPDTDAVLLVYCRSGRRSKEASDKLLALGYENVYDFGGIIDWPYDVVTD